MPARKFIEEPIMTPEVRLLRQNFDMGHKAGRAHAEAKCKAKIAKLQAEIKKLKAKHQK
jgi:hypothetical protein